MKTVRMISVMLALAVAFGCANGEGAVGGDDADEASTDDGSSEPEDDPQAGGEPADECEDPSSVTIGMLPPSLSNAGIYIAEQEGYFEARGVELVTEQFMSGADQTASLARGDVQVATGGPNPGLYNAVARGVGARVVADKGYGSSEFDWTQFVTTPDHYDGGLTSMSDVAGRSVAIVGAAGTQPLGLIRTLEANGLTIDDVSTSIMGFPDMVPALASGAVDVIFPLEPALTRLLESGDAVAIGSPTEGYPEQQHAVIFYSERFIADEPEAAVCFMTAYLEGVRDYNDAFMHGEGLDRVKEILVEAGVADDPDIFDRVNVVGLNPDGYVIEESIAFDIDYYLDSGEIETETSADEIIDHSFVDRALEILGTYDRGGAG